MTMDKLETKGGKSPQSSGLPNLPVGPGPQLLSRPFSTIRALPSPPKKLRGRNCYTLLHRVLHSASKNRSGKQGFSQSF